MHERIMWQLYIFEAMSAGSEWLSSLHVFSIFHTQSPMFLIKSFITEGKGKVIEHLSA